MEAEGAIIKVVDPCRPLECPALYDMSRPLEVEVGCGRGRFLTGRAAKDPSCEFLGVERMKERVGVFASKVRRLGISNAHVVRLEALYTFHYLLPEHHSHRLFGPLFLNALWKRLEIGGRLEFATDHEEYFHVVEECFAGDARFRRVAPMERGPDEWTEFETLFRGQGLPVYAAAWQSLAVEDEKPLAPLSVAPEDEPREGVVRRESRGKEWREEHADSD